MTKNWRKIEPGTRWYVVNDKSTKPLDCSCFWDDFYPVLQFSTNGKWFRVVCNNCSGNVTPKETK